MSKRVVPRTIPLIAALMILMFPGDPRAQTAAPANSTAAQKQDWWLHHDKWDTPLPDKSVYAGRKSEPAPRRDLSGTWDGLAEGGTQPKGAKEFPDDMRHLPDVPYTPVGKAARMANKAGEGEDQVPLELVNDPVHSCNPVGFPRSDLFNLKTMPIVQTQNKMLWLNQFYTVFRTIWTDGRELPKETVPRFYGYSVGHWQDDYTFVVETVGLNESTWLDNAGRPHSDEMRVEELFHRPSREILELTVTIDDPKFYTKPWVAANKLTFHLLPADFDMGEIICAPQEMEEYKKQVVSPVSHESK